MSYSSAIHDILRWFTPLGYVVSCFLYIKMTFYALELVPFWKFFITAEIITGILINKSQDFGTQFHRRSVLNEKKWRKNVCTCFTVWTGSCPVENSHCLFVHSNDKNTCHKKFYHLSQVNTLCSQEIKTCSSVWTGYDITAVLSCQ